MAAVRRLHSLAAGVALTVCVGLPAWVAAGDADVWDGGESCALLTPSDFDQSLAEKRTQKRLYLVMFHVSWCKVCQRAFPEFVNASRQVHEENIMVDFAHVDCTDEKSLCNRFTVRGYPTIKLFSTEEGVEPRTFKGSRNVASFVKYSERMMMPAVRSVAGEEEFTKALSSEVLAAFVAAVPAGQALPAGLEETATTWMDRHIFASSERLEALLPQGAAKPPADATLAVVSAGAQQQWPGRDNSSIPPPAVAFYTGSLENRSAVAEWVEKNRFPGIWALGESNFFEFTHSNRRTALLADDPANVSAETEAAFRGAAAESSDDFIFGVVDGVGWHDELADFNVYKKDLPRLFVTEENFDTWIEDADALRPATATADLRSLVAGRSLLRQNRKTLSKVFFYGREAFRLSKFLVTYAEKGPTQAATVALAFLLALGSALCVLWCLCKLCCILFSDPDECEYNYQVQAGKKHS